MLTFLALEPPPQDEFYMPLVLPVILTIIALSMFFTGLNRERRGEPGKWKWYSLIPAGLALFFGFNPTYAFIVDSTYRDIAHGNKMLASHIGSLGIPVIAIATMLVAEYIFRQHKARFQ